MYRFLSRGLINNFRIMLRAPIYSAPLIILLLGGCGPGDEMTYLEISSPGQNKALRITVAEPSALPGCEYCRRPSFIFLYIIDIEKNQIYRVLSTRLENDGVPFVAENIVARWTSENIALICLRASSLPDRGYRLNTKDEISVVETKGC